MFKKSVFRGNDVLEGNLRKLKVQIVLILLKLFHYLMKHILKESSYRVGQCLAILKSYSRSQLSKIYLK